VSCSILLIFDEEQVKIPFYIMTSGEHDAAEKFFMDNKCFGLDPKYVKFFKQVWRCLVGLIHETGRITCTHK
jgi:UDP-N-acetylglucosamine pyrophosphorylase